MRLSSKKAKVLSALLLIFVSFAGLTLTTNYQLLSTISAEPNCNNPGPGDLDFCIQRLQQEIDALKPAHEYNKQELAGLRSQLSGLESRISAISEQLEILTTDIQQREEDLAYAEEIFEEKTKNHYRFIRLYDPVIPFISAEDATQAFREIAFRQKAAKEDIKTMEQYAEDLFSLKKDKESLEENRENLAAVRAQVDRRADFLAGEVAKVEAYLATLTAKQQQFIAQKQASLNLPTSLGAGPLFCTDDRGLEPGFRPALAFYTYGIPHRVGMNQYGALGRANAGQNHEDILRVYFNNINFEIKPNINIFVEGYGTMPLETYLLGIYEMPESWPLEALKAQAVAARSYALSYTNNGSKSICTSQSCQVYKQPHKSGAWKTAVEQTAGKVITFGGEVATAWYASTSGGYTFTSADVGWESRGWTKRLRDTASGVSSFADLNSSAYDKDSPCFYAAQGWRKEYDNSAWLKAEEVVDIANVVLLAKVDPSTTSHLYQTDKPNPEGVETWSADKVRQELQTRNITPISSINNVSVTGVDWETGRTTQVTVNGVSFSGNEWRDFFNLRAPANIQIVGPLYNVERK